MAYHYSNPKRADDPHALPDVEVFYVSKGDLADTGFDPENGPSEPGWYWWACFPGCMPDGDASGPFDTEDAALADARDGVDDDEGDDA